MKISSKIVINTDLRRKITDPIKNWVYNWSVDTISNKEIVTGEEGTGKEHDKTWALAPTEKKGANPYTLSYVPSADTDGVFKNRLDQKWYGKYEGDTRYLKPYSNFYSVNNQVGDVRLDNEPPEFITDEYTEYVIFSPTYTKETNDSDETYNRIVADTIRHIEFQFKDKSGLDYKQFTIMLGDDILYSYYRPSTTDLRVEDIKRFSTADFKTKIGETPEPKDSQDFWIENITVKYDGANVYNVSFDLKASIRARQKCKSVKDSHCRFFSTPHELLSVGYERNTTIDEIKNLMFLNEIPTDYSTLGEWIDAVDRGLKLTGNIKIRVFDLASNCTEYIAAKEFWTINISDIDELTPVQITFFEPDPTNFFIKSGIEGSVWVSVQDMVKPLWRFPVESKLTDTSLGSIDPSTYGPIEWTDASLEKGVYNVLTGNRVYKVHNIKEYGYVEVEGWVETGNKKIDAFIKERTYNKAKFGPWICEDEGRKYNIQRFIPSYLRESQFADFIEFVQLYLNTVYLSLNNNKNISILEKIARVGNYTDIDKLENKLLLHYENEFGNEIPFDFNAIKEINTSLTPDSWGERDEDEVYNIVKYILGNLPSYNKYKGTNLGMAGAIKMFGFSCRIINLWANKNNPIERNPQFKEESSIEHYNDVFQTSRFNIEVDSVSTFEEFNKNISYFVKIIESIKPITKILNAIKYTVTSYTDIGIITNTIDSDIPDGVIQYDLTWTVDNDYKEFLKNSCYITYGSTKNESRCVKFGLPYETTDSTVSEGNKLKNYYTLLGKFFECNRTYLKITVSSDNAADLDCSIGLSDRKVYSINLSPKYFKLNTMDYTTRVQFTKIYDYIMTNENCKIKSRIIYLPGTNYICCP